MKIKNDLVRIKVGKKKYDFHNLILNEYLRRFALGQIDKENTLKGKLTQSRELNYILLKLDTSLEITESSKLYYNDFDICIINQAKHFQDLSENQITIQYNYKTKDNTFVVDISVSSQATETTSGSIKFLNNFYGKKITAIGFSSGWAPWANYSICAVLDTSNYNIYLEENQEFSVTRRDIITTDAEFYSNDKDKVPAPVHLAPYGVPQIINQPDIVDSEGTINSFYDNAYGALYSIGKGYMPNVIEEEKIIGENAKVVNNGTSLTISSVENEDVGTEALYPSEDLYPIGKFIEEIQTSEKGIQVSIKGNEEDAFVKIDGKSTQATRSGKNLLNLLKCSFSSCTLNSDNKSLTCSINNSYYAYVKTTELNNWLLQNKGKKITFSTGTPLNKTTSIVIYGTRSNGSTYQEANETGTGKCSITIADDFTAITSIELRFNRQSTTFTDTTTVINYAMLELGAVATDYEPYGASPSPEFPSEIKSVGDDVNLFSGFYRTNDDNQYGEYSNGVYTSNTRLGVATWVYKKELKNGEILTISYQNRVSAEFKYVLSNNDISTSDAIADLTSKSGTNISNDEIINNSLNYKYLYISFRMISGVTLGSISNIKLQKGTVATPYSEYGKGTVTIEQRGKNKLDLSKCTFLNCTLNNDGTITSNINNNYYSEINTTELNEFIMKNKGMPITFSIKEMIENANISVVIRGTRTNGTTYQDVNKSNDNKCTVTIADDFTKITGLSLRFNRKFTPFTDTTTTVSNIQLEEGIEPTDYEPYFSKDYVIQTTPLRSLPNGTKDTIEEDGIHRRVGSVVLDGSDDERWQLWNFESEEYIGFWIDDYIDYNNSNGSDVRGMCNLFSVIVNGNSNYENLGLRQVGDNLKRIYICIKKTNIETKDINGFKTWLQQNPLQLIYELSEEVVEPFTDEQLEVINSIETQKGTNIFSVNNELNPEIQVTEYKSPLYPIKDNYKYIILKYKVWQEVATGEYTEEDGYIQEITDTGYYYHQAIPLEEYGTLNTTIKYERG